MGHGRTELSCGSLWGGLGRQMTLVTLVTARPTSRQAALADCHLSPVVVEKEKRKRKKKRNKKREEKGGEKRERKEERIHCNAEGENR